MVIQRPQSTRTPRKAVRSFRATVWISIYIFFAAFPLLVLLLGQTPKGGGFWWDFSMGLGFAGLSMMGLQFVLTARFRRATAPFGIDIIYYFHRWAAIGAVALVLIHYLILRVRYVDALGPANPASAPWYMSAGRLALLLFLVLIISSVWRKQLRIEYDRWRIWHGVFAVFAVILAIAHIQGVGHYTRAPWKQATWIAFSALWILVLGYIRFIKPWSLLKKPYRVASVLEERGNSWTVTIEPEKGAALSFLPGQFAWLTLGSSPFRAKEHPFSFSGSAENGRSLQFSIKELGDFTRTIRHIQPGTIAYVDGPHGVFTPDYYPDAPGFGMIAGGVGIAPIMSILRTLADRGETRPVFLVFGNSNWDRVLFREELELLKSRLNLKLVHVLQDPPPGWDGETGMLTRAILQKVISPDARSFVYFMCGPKGMTDLAHRALRELGIPMRRIHSEHFEMV